jgi:hypothetical protein
VAPDPGVQRAVARRHQAVLLRRRQLHAAYNKSHLPGQVST